MSLKSKIEAVIYASEEPVTLQQLVGLLTDEAQAELDALAADQASLPLDSSEDSASDEALGETDAGFSEETSSGEASDTEGCSEDAVSVEEGSPAAIQEAGAEVSSEQDSDAEVMAKTAEASTDAVALKDAEAAEATSREDAASEGSAVAEEVVAKVDEEAEKRRQRDNEKLVRDHIRRAVDALINEYANSDRGIEIREVASGFRMGTKPEYHDAVRGFVKSLKPPLKLTLPALETLAVVAYKQPVTAAEISEIRGVDSAGVLGGLMTRKLIATAGRKQVIGRPMLYKTTRDFLLRFGLKDIGELPSMEEFEKMAGELAEQEDLPMESAENIIEEANARGDAEFLREANSDVAEGDGETQTADALEESAVEAEVSVDAGEEVSSEQESAGDSQDVSAQAEDEAASANAPETESGN